LYPVGANTGGPGRACMATPLTWIHSAHWLASTNNRYQRAKCAIHMHNWQSCSFLNQLLSEFVLRIKLANSVQSRVDEYGLASHFRFFVGAVYDPNLNLSLLIFFPSKFRSLYK
jgi:hypothetical protein